MALAGLQDLAVWSRSEADVEARAEETAQYKRTMMRGE